MGNDPVNLVDPSGTVAPVVMYAVASGLVSGGLSALEAHYSGQNVGAAFGTGFVAGAVGAVAPGGLLGSIAVNSALSAGSRTLVAALSDEAPPGPGGLLAKSAVSGTIAGAFAEGLRGSGMVGGALFGGVAAFALSGAEDGVIDRVADIFGGSNGCAASN